MNSYLELKNFYYVQLGNGAYSIRNSCGNKVVISEGGDLTPVRALKGVRQNEAVVSVSQIKNAARIFDMTFIFAVATRPC